MKLRIHDNTIRLRLTRSEVSQLRDTGLVRDVIQFGSGASLAYSVECSRDETKLQACFRDSSLRVTVPEGQVSHWASSEDVGIEAPDAQPAVLIEKDFQCAHRADLDPEAYPNPLLN